MSTKTEPLFARLRSERNKEILIDRYRETLNNEDSNAVDKRYASDMLTALTDESQKSEINKFWNALHIRDDIKDNKIEFLHETVEYLRDLVIKVTDPDTSMWDKHAIVRDVKNKNFIANIRGEIQDRIHEEQDRIEKEIAEKDKEYKKRTKEALKRNS